MRPDFSSLYQIERLVRRALDTGLPGTRAHLTMAPRPRHGWRPGVVPDDARPAASLVLLYPVSARPHIVLTVRSEHLHSHASQVSFPGGAIEPKETVTEAALREATEEVGVDPAEVQILGRLSTLYIPASHFAMHPVIGTTPARPSFRRASPEVGRILEASLEALGTTPPRRGYRGHGANRFDVPYFELGSERVWGATAMVLAELLALITQDDGSVCGTECPSRSRRGKTSTTT